MTNKEEYKKLLDKFKCIYSEDTYRYRPTLMEICSYPTNRFEEICSRLFKFFLNPNNPHNMGGLFLETLFEVVKKKDSKNDQKYAGLIGFTNYKSVSVETEVMTKSGNFIDIAIFSDKFVVCIENKFGATLYNDLDDYQSHIESLKGDRATIYIVISKKDELPNNKNFVSIRYDDFFSTLKSFLGEHLVSCDQKYLTILIDWIQTLENKMGLNNEISEEEKRFFIENEQQIESLIQMRSKFLDEQKNLHKERIAKINEILKKDYQQNWWIYENFDLGFSFNDNTGKIGIESIFNDISGNFVIKITTWTQSPWLLYQASIKEAFPGKNEAKSGNRYFMEIDSLDKTKSDEDCARRLSDIQKILANVINKVNEKGK